MSKTDSELDHRFRRFLDSRPWAEPIDQLPLTEAQASAPKADYFVDNRELIVEVKSVQKDMGDDFQRALDPFTKEKDWPVFYGPTNVAPFLERHPRRDEIMRVLVAAVTKALDNQIKKANKQVRATKELFALSSPAGFVVYLNDRSEVVAPDVIAHRVARLFNSCHADGRNRFSSIQGALILSATHFVTMVGAPPALPCIFVPRERLAENHVIQRVSDRMIREWAAYNGSPLLRITIEELGQLSNAQRLVSDLTKPAPSGPRARYQVWIDEYHKEPFLRAMSDDRLIKLGADLLGRLGASFLKKTRYKPSETERLVQMRVFTGLLEELKVRGIGLDQVTRQHRDYTVKLIRDLSGVEPSTREPG